MLRIRLGNVPDNWRDNPYRGKKETRKCAECGADVTRYLSQVRIDRPWYCSNKCTGAGSLKARVEAGTWKHGTKKRRGAEVPCAFCGNKCYRSQGALVENKEIYCSKACSDKSKSKPPVIKQCEYCDKEMVLKPSQAAKRYCCRRCESLGKTKRPLDWTYNSKFAKLDTAGYVMVWEPSHPNKSFHGWQYMHRLVAERKIGRYLRSDEHVHHVNGDKQDFSMENLEVLSPADHNAITQRELKERRSRVEDELAKAKARIIELERKFGPLA